MKALRGYRKLLLGLLLALTAMLIYVFGYAPAKTEYDIRKIQLDADISALRVRLAENEVYGAVDGIPAALAEIEESRRQLYEKFPVELREEDQIMYVLYLEEIFGNEIKFEFGSVDDLLQLSDGSLLQTLTLSVNYECSYEEFRELMRHLSADEKISSVYSVSMDYDAEKDIVSGSVTILRYLIASDLTEYQKPDIAAPDTGKDNIFIEGSC